MLNFKNWLSSQSNQANQQTDTVDQSNLEAKDVNKEDQPTGHDGHQQPTVDDNQKNTANKNPLTSFDWGCKYTFHHHHNI